jgi:hypothetical protein
MEKILTYAGTEFQNFVTNNFHHFYPKKNSNPIMDFTPTPPVGHQALPLTLYTP